MHLFSSRTTAALGLCVFGVLLAACSPQDGSAPIVAGKSAPTATMTNSNTTAQTTKPPATGPAAGETRRITIPDTQAAIAAGTTLVVDVRDEGAYKTSHIKGAKNIPLSQFEQRAGELPKDKLIITYCA